MKQGLFICAFSLFISQASAQLAAADSLYQAGAYKQAYKLYDQLPQSAAVLFKKARIELQYGNPAAATILYRDGLALDSLNTTAHYSYARLIVDKEPIKAKKSLDFLLSRQPDNAAYHYYMGKVYESQKEFKPALTSFNNAINLNPKYRNAVLALLKIHSKKKRHDSVIALALPWLKNNPEDISVNKLLCKAYLRNKNYEKAAPLLEHLKLIELYYAKNYSNLGFTRLMLDEYEQCIENYHQYIAMTRDKDATIYLHLSIAATRLKDYEKAAVYARIALNIKQPATDKEYLQLASIYRLDGDLAQTFKILQEAYEENPTSESINYQLAVTADYFFKDKQSILKYYQRYAQNFSDGKHSKIVTDRIEQLSQELFMDTKE